MNLLQELEHIDIFKEIPQHQLQWIIDNGELRQFEEGEYLFSKGESMDHLFIVLNGKFDIKAKQNNQFRLVGHIEANEVSGNLPYSRAKLAGGYGVASKKANVLALHIQYFPEMIQNHHELTTVLVHEMSTRIRKFTQLQQQNDKMMALGKLSAGLAHELNNPSAAVIRSAQELKKHLGFLPEDFKRVIQIKISEGEVDTINDMLFAKISAGTSDQSMMEKANLEDEIVDWLEDNDMSECYEIAETFADFDLNLDDLEMVKNTLRKEDLGPVVNWLSQVLTTEKLVNEIEEASQRIKSLVGSVKSYTHMDQSPEKQEVDLHIGIRNTLTMLNHKIKKGNIQVVEQFDEQLPKPNVFISELNQVWTNLIDNAIDALESTENKELKIETFRQGEFVNVNIIDNGKGIPEDIQSKIFDPFFTTKAIGKGTGLGLDVVHQIITQHNGAVKVTSSPGNTTFNVCIPIST